ncbi:MAG: shikimate dehydrogenase [Acidiferrobacterales bacterium]
MATRKFFAVFGNPVGHSKSPQIHTMFAQQFGFDIEYRVIEAPLDGFSEAISTFRDEGASGCNITVPFKQEAWQLADSRSGRAEMAGAVNTFRFEDDGTIFGDNTDGVGLLRDLTLNLDTTLFQKRVLVVGAGGAARGILGPLIEQAPRTLVLANRTLDKAVELAKIFSTIGPIEPCGLNELKGQQFELVINGTAASLSGEVPPLPDTIFSDDALAYDLMYASQPTAFMQWAKTRSVAHISDGLGMLVEQAAESFALWLGERPETKAVVRTLREPLKSRAKRGPTL